MKKIAAVLLTDTHLKETNIAVNKAVFKQAVQFCKDNGLKKIYHLGDILDSRKAQTLSILTSFLEILDDLFMEEITLVAIPGNHDKTSYSSKESFLDPFKFHPSFELYDSYTVLDIEGIDVHLLPYFDKETYSELLSTNTKEIIPSSEDRRILLTHIGVNGAVMNNGIAVDGIERKLFSVFNRVLVGHYHDKQIFDNFEYIGGTIQHNYGETPEKGLTILYHDLTTETKELDYPKYRVAELNVNEINAATLKELKEITEESEDNLRVVLKGEEAKIKSFNTSVLLDMGLNVLVKPDDIIVLDDLEEDIQAFEEKNLVEYFEKFCTEKLFSYDDGMKYLKLQLKIEENA